jgi:hypothetical protein
MTHHDDARLLIPWYVNGTLNEQDMAQVEQHLEGCTECRVSVSEGITSAQRLHRSLNRSLKQDDHETRLDRLLASRKQHFSALSARLGTNRSQSASRPPAANVRSRLLIPALVTSLIIAVAVPVVFYTQPDTQPEDPTLFELRTDNPESTSPVLQLVFKADVSERDIELLLNASGSTIGQPTDYGVYRIALSTSDPMAMLARLRDHPAVRWAEIEL